MNGPAPTLATDRLRLRAHRVDDLPASAAMWAHPAVVRHIGGRPFSRHECWNRLQKYDGHWNLLGFGYWAIEDRISGAFIGEAGIADTRREISPPQPLPESGWAFVPSAFGRGIATEAMTCILDWADAREHLRNTACIIDADHAASIRVATKLGYRWSHATTLGDAETQIYVRSAG